MASTAQPRAGARRANSGERRSAAWRVAAHGGGALDQLGGLAVAVVAVSLALIARLTVGPALGDPPFLLLGLAVLACACAGGARAGVPAVGISVGVLAYVFFPPPGLAMERAADVWSVLLFAGEGLVLTGLCERLREHRARADSAFEAARREGAARRDGELAARRMETGLAALDRLGKALGAELAPAEVATLAAQVAASMSGASVGALAFQRRGESVDSIRQSVGSPEQAARLELELAELAAAVVRAPVLRVDDVRHHAALARLSAGHNPIRSLLLARVEGRSGRGFVALGHAVPGVFDAHHERLVCVLAAQAAAGIDNAHHHADAQQALAAAQVAARTKDEFLSTLSHELRTPLNAIIGWTHLLQGGKLDADDTRRAVETIARNASLQESMIGELLDMSSLLNGRLRLHTEPLDLRRVVEEAVATARGYARAKSIDLQLVASAEPVAVMGDAGRLQQVVWSLLSNAVKFTPAGGRVRVQVATAGGKAEMVVRDTGAGMEPALLSRLFSRFSLADASSTRPSRGLGLGLAVARGLVELHDGQVLAESAGRGLGSTFTVRLPLSSHAPEPAERRQPPAEPRRTERAAAPAQEGAA